MNQCPVCSTEIQDSFGLIECPGCHKILFADFDGTLKIHDEGAEPMDPVIEVAEDGVPIAASAFSDDWNTEESSSSAANDADDAVFLDIDKNEDIPFELTPVENTRPPRVEIQSEEPEEVPAEPLSTIQEINAFANSEASSLKQGALIYNLKIKNIDTEDLKEEIIGILKENKLNIDVKNLKFALPTLELKDLNPVKVSIIVSRIKHLPVDLEWIQKSMVDSGGSND